MDVAKPIEPEPSIFGKLKEFEGIATASILAVPGAVCLMKTRIDPNTAILYWLLFVVLAGICIDPQELEVDGFRELVGWCFLPSLALVLVLSFRGALDYIFKAAVLTVASVHPIPRDAPWIIRIGGLYLFIFLATAPAVAIASLARPMFLSVGTALWKAEPEKVETLERNIVVILRILALLIGALMAFR